MKIEIYIKNSHVVYLDDAGIVGCRDLMWIPSYYRFESAKNTLISVYGFTMAHQIILPSHKNHCTLTLIPFESTL